MNDISMRIKKPLETFLLRAVSLNISTKCSFVLVKVLSRKPQQHKSLCSNCKLTDLLREIPKLYNCQDGGASGGRQKAHFSKIIRKVFDLNVLFKDEALNGKTERSEIISF